MLDWQWHLGNKVKCRDYIYVLTAIDQHKEQLTLDARVKINGFVSLYTKDISECHPVLRKLSSMTADERMKFMKYWMENCKSIVAYVASDTFYLDFELGVLTVYEAVATSSKSQPLPAKMVMYLVKEGFDCRQFPEGTYIFEEEGNGSN